MVAEAPAGLAAGGINDPLGVTAIVVLSTR
jgi:hypothetical protein